MKKILFTLLICLFMIPGVNADETSETYANNVFKANEQNIYDIYNKLMKEYDEYKIDYPYYHISFQYSNLDSNYKVKNDSQSYLIAFLYYFKSNDLSSDSGRFYASCYSTLCFGNPIHELKDSSGYGSFNSARLSYKDFRNYASNMVLTLDDGTSPIYYLDVISSRYIEVNLDDYEYVILNLKSYSSTKAFETNLQVKGSIAITPVYEFGTVEKENITDLCNTTYSDFTDYRFFVLKNDLINNAVYIVKNCQEDSSSFRFDSTVFDVTYVTDENVDDPVITFGGVEYHTIPFNKLSNTVNKNEEEGFIPGANEGFDPFGSIGDYLSSFWNTLTTFMGLVTKFFNTLPVEIRAVSITAFTTAITLGVIKFIKS